MTKNNPERFKEAKKRFTNSFLVIIVAVVASSFVTGVTIYQLQEIKFGQQVLELRQSTAILNHQMSLLGKERLAGDYQWDDQALGSQYSDVFWNKITNNRLEGFSPAAAVVEKELGCLANNDSYENYLRVEGGMCGVGYWLEIEKDNQNTMNLFKKTIKINSLEGLISNFAPIESEAEAVSFVANTKNDLSIDNKGVPGGHVLTIPGGFLVQLVRNNTYGCGSHQSIGVIYLVTHEGDIKLVAAEKEDKAESPEQMMCVD